MRLTSALPILLAALVCIFGCGGGSPVDPNLNPAPTGQGNLEGDVIFNGGFVANGLVIAYDLATGIELDRANTDHQGNFVLDVPAGQVGVWATAPEGSAGPLWVNVADAHDPPSQLLDLTGGTAGVLIGRVIDTVYGEPVPNALVTYGSQTVATDGFGFYTFTGVGANATGDVRIEAGGFSTSTQALRAGQVDRVELLTTGFFTVKPSNDTGTSIGGVIRDIEDGSPLGGAIITISRPNDANFAPIRRQTNLGGVWRFHNLLPGSYALVVEREGYLPMSSSAVLNVRDGVLNAFLTANPEARATVNGTVFAPNGTTPLNNVQVVASSGVYGAVSTTTSGSGAFVLADLVVGVPYTFMFRPATTAVEAVRVVASPALSGLQLTISLPENETGAINGRVTKTGQAVPPVGADIEAEKVGEPNSGQVFRTKVDANGNYGLNNLPPGRYLVRASYLSPQGPQSLSLTGSTDVVKGQVTKRNITFP